MNKKIILGLLAVLLLWAAASHRANAAGDPIKNAMDWLVAVHDKNEGKLTAYTHFPFVMDGDVVLKSKACNPKMTAINAKKFAIISRCIIDDHLFGESVPPNVSELAEDWKRVRSLEDLPRNMRRFKKVLVPLAKDHVFVMGSLLGSGINYDLVMAVSADGKISAVVADSEVYE